MKTTTEELKKFAVTFTCNDGDKNTVHIEAPSVEAIEENPDKYLSEFTGYYEYSEIRSIKEE